MPISKPRITVLIPKFVFNFGINGNIIVSLNRSLSNVIKAQNKTPTLDIRT